MRIFGKYSSSVIKLFRALYQFSKLSDFYNKCSNLQYFKYLVQVPSLPDTPPNFLITAELSLDVTKIESLKVRLERSRLLSLNLNPQNDPVISMEPARKLSSSRSRDSHLQFVELLNN